ncbi:MAG TPA: serine/threonine-protein kinase [Candidatus Obscuribacter sp.]|nr:serine/threonine-protein kinase [Candidatus Obscuribacter sp.]HND04860.1 serine/threonine-protein kinase [Candidatus Obscuribacter sp.]
MKICPTCLTNFADDISKCPKDDADLILDENQPKSTLGPGHIFAGQYEILSILGKGGMSVVYRARHRLMDRIVAIKVLQGDAEAIAIERFKQEAKSASLLNHPNIISIYDFGIFGEQAYLVMDCLEGKTLADVLETEGHLNADRAVKLFRQACLALENAHKHGVIHRDLKPSNICLVPDENGHEHLKIVDFGIAKLMNKTGLQQLQLTQTGEVFGSPLYMSPEQCTGKSLDNRSDIYSLGCLMYESLTGKPPIVGSTAYETMALHVSGKPEPFSKAAPELKIDPSIEALVFRCLEKRPIDRYQSAAEILSDLPTILPESGSMKIKQVEHPTKQKREMKRLRYAFWTLFVLLAAVLSYMIVDDGADNDKGTVLEKTIWNAETTMAQTCMDWHWYELSRAILLHTEHTATTKFSNRARLLTCLNLEYNLYKKARMFEDLERVSDLIALTHEEIIVNMCDRLEKDLDELEAGDSNATSSVNRVIAPYVIDRLRHAVNGLASQSKDQRAEVILLRAKQIMSNLLGKQDSLIADLNVMLAECYHRQERQNKVRPLLQEALKIYEGAARADERKRTMALVDLGQLDRDEGNFDQAKVELEKAIKTAENLPKKDLDLLSRILNSYGSLLIRMGKPAEAETYFKRAQELAPLVKANVEHRP